MTLLTAAQKVLAAAQSGVLDNIDGPVREMNAVLTASFDKNEIFVALGILNEARKAAYSHRCNIVLNLQQLERSALYGSQPSTKTHASWQLSG